jgi:hypothetical protein
MLLAALLYTPVAGATDVLICYSSGYEADVVAKIVGTGLFPVVDEFNCGGGTPTDANFAAYDAVLVYSDSGFLDPTTLGDRLATFVDNGGGVVEAVFANGSVPLSGRFESQGYEAFTGNAQGGGNGLTMVIDDPAHPIMAGVVNFNAGTSSFDTSNAVLQPGGTQIAHYSQNGLPLVATLETKPGRTVGLNFYPPSSAIRADFWSTATDGALLLANSLAWVGILDADGDGWNDSQDNCPDFANPAQDDLDLDGLGDLCDPCDDRFDPDTDADGVCDSMDVCPNGSDVLDADGDLSPDGCDACPFDPPNQDLDNDGICNIDDVCPNGSDIVDSDGDGIADGCDDCPAGNDADFDQVCDAFDRCQGFDDNADIDADNTPDACDACPFDAPDDDLDDDGVCNSSDVCPAFDDAIDGDGDGAPDACDPCPAWALDDEDGDGVCGDVDACPGFNDASDADGDDVPNGCDACPVDPAGADDDDIDGVCNTDDICDGFDDTLDQDLDRRPDDCDNCPTVANTTQADGDDDGFGASCDCEDGNPAVSPGATEACDGSDNDCDGDIDEAGSIGEDSWYADRDEDGQGNPDEEVTGCEQPPKTSTNADDCDDHDPQIFTGAGESCDEVDNNCNGEIDEIDDCAPADPTGGDGSADPGGCGCDSGRSGLPTAALLAFAVLPALRRRR